MSYQALSTLSCKNMYGLRLNEWLEIKMQSLPPDLHAYTLKNPQRLDRVLNTVAAVYNILHSHCF